jgi:hypothetical protein
MDSLFDEAEELAEPLPKYEAPKGGDVPQWLLEKYLKAGFKPWLWKGLGPQKTWHQLNAERLAREAGKNASNDR